MSRLKLDHLQTFLAVVRFGSVSKAADNDPIVIGNTLTYAMAYHISWIDLVLRPGKMIEELHHIQIAMPKGRESDARNFYCGVLGFSEVKKPNVLRDRGGVWFQCQNVRIHLGVEEPFVPALKVHPGFRVGSLENTVAHLNAAGIDVRTDIDLPDIKRIYISDPFGNRIELLEVIAS
ncbi:VOC family protein [uncultured Ruegeria sp.]|uniref:VOC family protein n=1 Tax=uncultured Ruegeria sp. TaxID=259304 RepID=UPI00261F07CD|nr:VOC family protein [uncultured Ruegeria sp.]